MLILARKVGEAIVVADVVVFKIVELRGSQIVVGIEAPDNIDIYRKEVWDRIQLEQGNGPCQQ